jgi:uncharacterized membrane protein
MSTRRLTMYLALLIARIVHILGGVIWVGSMVFISAFLFPALRDSGPDGAKFAAALQRRRFTEIVPAIAVLSMLAGLWLFWQDSVTPGSGFMRSGPGRAYSTGAVLAIVAFIIGVAVTRPAMMKAMALSESAVSAEQSQREAMLAQAQSLRMRGARFARVIAILLVLAATAMAVGRYV